MPHDMFLAQWVCLIEKVSGRDTSAFNVSPSGRKYYGLYQIPKQWCGERRRGGNCNVTCAALLDDDIRDDTACAVQIADNHGFQFWELWNKRCKNNHFTNEEIHKCPELLRISRECDRKPSRIQHHSVLSSRIQHRMSRRFRRSAYESRSNSSLASDETV
ncbi:hypothetical protein PYW08_010097 [Mythimna loreyi]|uniref:Uncharacterized protein n=1 Tax=Mythimna loreyi TaxID=667449 RepID=A0ACC2Q5Y8_9NEOP|nr:hypothetical protein PYW08_010097 [Mythimna loreyi]